MNWGLLLASPLILVGGILLLLSLVILLFVVFPLKIDLLYQENNFFVSLKILGFSKTLIDSSKEKESPNEKNKNAKKPKEQKKKNYFNIAKIAYAGIKVLIKGGPLTVDKFYLDVTFGGDDPADLGILFGRVHTVLGASWPALQRILMVRKSSIQTRIDFIQESTQIHYAHVVLPIPLIRVLHIALTVLLRYQALSNEEQEGEESPSEEQPNTLKSTDTQAKREGV